MTKKLRPPLSKDMDSSSIKDSQESATTAKVIKKESDIAENVAEKVKGVTISQSHIYNTNSKEGTYDDSNIHIRGGGSKYHSNNGLTIGIDEASNVSSNADPVEDLVREWERDSGRELSPTLRKIARHAASINIEQGRGITVSDLVDKGFGESNAEKLLPQSVDIGLLMRLENRLGKQYQYVLSNYVQILKPKDPVKKEDEILPSDVF